MNVRRFLAAALMAPLVFPACTGGTAPDGKGNGSENVGSASQASNFPYVQFGTRCQEDYENNWWTACAGATARCSGFVNAVAVKGGVGNFYYNLHGGRTAFENPDTCGWACGYVDSVDFFYAETHGCKSNTNACWFMWDDADRRANSSNMRLGDSGRQNMVFSTFSCNTLTQDSYMWARWAPVFAGGLVMTTGSHPSLYLASSSSTGSDYFNRMANGEPIAQAWHDAMLAGNSNNKPAVMNTGANSTDCWNRQAGVKLSNLLGTSVLRDSAIGYTCWSGWN